MNLKHSANITSDNVVSMIDALRFPLIVGIVFIHDWFFKVDASFDGPYPVYGHCVALFSHVIFRICVPLFFLFSGFMFFYSVKSFSTEVYLGKLRRRFFSLFIPYLFWNALAYLTLYVLSELHVFNYRFEYDPITLFWGHPIAWQLWFVRDLMVCCVLSPLIYFLVTRCRYFAILFLGLAWFFDYNLPVVGANGLSTAALFFFSLGAWCAYNKRDLFALTRPIRFLSFAWPVFVILAIYDFPEYVNALMENLSILSGIILLFWSCDYLMSRNSIRPVPILVSSSFFIFAVHILYVETPLGSMLIRIFNPSTDIAMTAIYFANALLTVLISLGIYYLLSLFMPSFCKIITGGRVYRRSDRSIS